MTEVYSVTVSLNSRVREFESTLHKKEDPPPTVKMKGSYFTWVAISAASPEEGKQVRERGEGEACWITLHYLD